jgi:hypothetical protein
MTDSQQDTLDFTMMYDSRRVAEGTVEDDDLWPRLYQAVADQPAELAPFSGSPLGLGVTHR